MSTFVVTFDLICHNCLILCLEINFVQVYRNTIAKENLLGSGKLQVPPPGESIEAWHELIPPDDGDRPRVQTTVISGLRPVERRSAEEVMKAAAEV